MQFISSIKPKVIRTAKMFGCATFVLSLAACNSSSYQQQVQENTVSPITHVARLITTPFRGSVERDLRSLIHEVGNQEVACDSTTNREKLISQLISPRSVNELQHGQEQYWEKALPLEVARKQEVLDSVEQNLALHMRSLKESISATGLKVASTPTQVALLTTPSLQQAPKVVPAIGFAPVPILKHPAPYTSLAKFAPVPMLKSAKGAAEGGPFVPLRQEDFTQRYRELSATLKQLVALENIYTALPIGNPMPEGAVTSGFGVRRDPFNHRWAQHTGIDFSAAGTPVAYSTGAGTVIFAGKRSDYGNMVVVDHGHGLTSRYAHLSQISVREGQKITDHTAIGYQGSTGRATGNHLHYEVRMNGRAIDPVNFVTANSPVCRYKTASLQ